MLLGEKGGWSSVCSQESSDRPFLNQDTDGVGRPSAGHFSSTLLPAGLMTVTTEPGSALRDHRGGPSACQLCMVIYVNVCISITNQKLVLILLGHSIAIVN